jgi:hypothetical protein
MLAQPGDDIGGCPARAAAMVTESALPVRQRRRRQPQLLAGVIVAGLSASVMCVAAVILLMAGR